MTSRPLEAAALIDAACERAGHDDFGADTWQEGLAVLVWSLTTEADLNDIGRHVHADQLTGYLANRLAVEHWYAKHPEIDDQKIVAPLFGLGLPRTSSTALSYLFACDRGRRSLRTWEAGAPCPPPETATEHTDARIVASAATIEVTHAMFPDFAGMLPSSPTGPQECLLIMALDFRSQVFEGMAFVPSYDAWLRSCDMTPAYCYHQRVLKLLQWRCPPRRWWLKTPSHMFSIDALNVVYPDARFVMTHRDIGSVLPSLCALKQALSGPLTNHQDLLAIGAFETETWTEALQRLIAFRDAGREDRFFDVGFAAVQADPIAAVEQLYDKLGDDLTSETRQRMTQWWGESASERRRGPRPDPSSFGLDVQELREAFAFYHQRFGVDLDILG